MGNFVGRRSFSERDDDPTLMKRVQSPEAQREMETETRVNIDDGNDESGSEQQKDSTKVSGTDEWAS